MEPINERIVVFTDGACSGNPGPGGWGAIVRTPDGNIEELGGGEKHTTNNRMEMLAAVAALERVADRLEQTVELYTDSTYLISGVTEWVAGWKKKGWVRADKGPVLNRDIWERLDALDAARREHGRVEWRYVRGHSGTPGNERCDVIAVSYAQGRPVPLYSGHVGGYLHDLNRRPATIPKVSGGPPTPRGKRTGAGAGAGKVGPSGPATYLSLVGGKLERHASWSACERSVKGRSGARYRKVSSPDEEKDVLRSWGIASE